MRPTTRIFAHKIWLHSDTAITNVNKSFINRNAQTCLHTNVPQRILIAVPPTSTARYTPTSIVFDSTRWTTYFLQIIRSDTYLLQVIQSDTYFLQATRSATAYSLNENECEVLYTITRSSYQDYRTLMGNTMMKIVLITDGRCTYRIDWSPTDTKKKKNVTSLTTTRRTTGYYHY